MAKLSNSPLQSTIFELECRKSFAFSVEIRNENDVVSELAGSALIFSMGRIVGGEATLVFETTSTDGVFYLQASDLDLEPGRYQFVITWRVVGYSLPVVKGEVILSQNVEFLSTGSQYGGGSPEQAIIVTLSGLNVIRVQARGGADDGSGGQLNAISVTEGYVPTADGLDGWAWAAPDTDFVRDVVGGATDNIEVTVTGDPSTELEVTADITDKVATKAYVDEPLGFLGRVGTVRSRVAATFISGTHTTLHISTIVGGLWTTEPTDFPLDVETSGVILRITEITGTESPQQATVEQQPVNGVVKVIPAGSLIQVR